MKPTVGVGILGTGWMAKAHTAALRSLATTLELPFDVRLVALGGRSPERTEGHARQWGFESWTTDWRALVGNPRVDVVANLTGNDMHAAPSIAALHHGKHVLCEKPLATSRADLAALLEAAAGTSAVNACGYNYRFVPAVRLARDLVASGRLGALRHVNIAYEQDWAATEATRNGWRFEDPVAGSSVYDLSHIIDLFRWIVGDPATVTASISSLRPEVSGLGGVQEASVGTDPEDSYSALVRTARGLTATLRASRIATGRKGRQVLEITGDRGSLEWDMENMNHLRVYLDDADGVPGFRNVLVTETDHPFMKYWYAPGHIIGWDHTVIHQWISILAGITGFDPQVPTDYATFEDGARAVLVADAIRISAAQNSWVQVEDARAARLPDPASIHA